VDPVQSFPVLTHHVNIFILIANVSHTGAYSFWLWRFGYTPSLLNRWRCLNQRNNRRCNRKSLHLDLSFWTLAALDIRVSTVGAVLGKYSGYIFVQVHPFVDNKLKPTDQ
jgi:hypothetical protein